MSVFDRELRYASDISTEELETIFDLFHRGDDADGHGGLGLGLWVAREMVLCMEAESTCSAPASDMEPPSPSGYRSV